MTSYIVLSRRVCGRGVIIDVRTWCPDCGQSFETTKSALAHDPLCPACRREKRLDYWRQRRDSKAKRKAAQKPKCYVAANEFKCAWYPSRESWEAYAARIGETEIDRYCRELEKEA